MSEVVETIHRDILHGPRFGRGSAPRRTRGITGLVYRSVRGVTRLTGGGVDAALARRLRSPGGRILLLIHGLCRNDLQWRRQGHDHGAALARDLGLTPVHLRYNTGLHVSANGRALAERMEALCAAWPAPVEEIVVLAHSMGGLVARSACHHGAAAGHAWPSRLSKLVCLGTPHHGAPAERGGNRFETLLEATPYAAALGRLGKLRSAGITDLRHGNLLDDDREERDRFARAGDPRRPVPLPDGVDCHFLAASLGRQGGDLKGSLLGDGIVPVASALGRHDDPGRDLRLPDGRRWIAWESNHLDLLSSPEVYAQIRARLASGAA